MKIVYIAGFFAPVQAAVQAGAAALVEERSVVWIRQRPDGQPDINMLKADLFDQTSRGASEILILAFVFRQHEHVLGTLESIAVAARRRHPGILINIQRFKNAQDSAGVLAAITAFGPHRRIPVPDSLDLLENWVKHRWSGKLVLHPRAIRAAKQSVFEDVGLIYTALTLLAEEYWLMRTANPTDAKSRRDSLMERLGALGLELAPSISSTRAGEQGEEYRVAYPIGGTVKRVLDQHLKKGSGRDERNCLRIYFLWDDERRLVVIGWLPSHLTTRDS